MVWIIVGIITFSLVTAMLTTEITAANSQPPPSMEDRRIALIWEHEYEAIVVANKGGIIIPLKRSGNFSSAIVRLIGMLDAGEVDGFVLDKYEMMLYYNHFQANPHYQFANNILKKTQLSEISHKDDFSYGILVKNVSNYNFLEEFVTSNRDIINSCNNLLLRKYTRRLRLLHPKHSIFTTEGEIFWPTFMSCSVLVVIIFLCGTLYELKRWVTIGKMTCSSKLLVRQVADQKL